MVPTEYVSLGDLTPAGNALTTLYDHQAASGELPYAGPEVNFYGSDTYHLWTLIGTANYYQYSHDGTWLGSEWSSYQRAIAYSLAEVGSDGLMSVQGTADWARSDQGGENIEANVLLYEALVTGAQLATAEGDAAHASGWAATAATLKAGRGSTPAGVGHGVSADHLGLLYPVRQHAARRDQLRTRAGVGGLPGDHQRQRPHRRQLTWLLG